MGIGISVESAVLPQSWLFRSKGQAALVHIVHQTRAWSEARGFGSLFTQIILDEMTLEMRVLPVTEPIFVSVADDRLSISAKTSDLGPGYHEAVVDLLDHLAANLALEWDWGPDGQGDEVGYVASRDFVALQAQHEKLLLCILRITAREGRGGSTRFSLSIPSKLATVAGAIRCPLGEKPLDWPERVTAAEAEGQRVAAAEFFLWWDEAKDGAFWQALLRAQIWQNAEWRRPVTPEDAETNTHIDYIARKAGEFGPLPKDLQTALEEQRRYRNSSDIPPQSGIGYRKAPVRRMLHGGWSIALPGWLGMYPVDGKTDFSHDTFWLGTTAYALEEGASEGKFKFPSLFPGPDIAVSKTLIARMSEIEVDIEDVSGTQTAVIVFEGEDGWHWLSLTLALHLDAPFERFPDWVQTVTFHAQAP